MTHFKIVSIGLPSIDRWYKEVFVFDDSFFHRYPINQVLPGRTFKLPTGGEEIQKFETVIVIS